MYSKDIFAIDFKRTGLIIKKNVPIGQARVKSKVQYQSRTFRSASASSHFSSHAITPHFL
jgi:hypothetical protein